MEPAPSRQLQLLDPSVCPLASLPVHSVGARVLPSADHPTAPPTTVSAPQAEGSAQQGWMVGQWWLQDQGLVTGSRGSHRVSSPRQGMSTPSHSAGWEWVGQRRQQLPSFGAAPEGKDDKVGGDSRQGLEPARRSSAECPQMVVSLMAEQPAALPPGGRLPSSGTKASPAGRH